MKSLIINILSVFLFAATFTSCQKVIDVDLNSADPKVVIEGIITDSTGPHLVKLSYTGSYFDVNKFNGIPGATVIISDNTGNTDTLKESPMAGYYFTQKITGTSGRTYTLQVNVNNEKYYASSTMPSRVEIDSINYYKPEDLNFGPDRRSDGKLVKMNFMDPKGQGNYYLIKMYVNDTLSYFSFQSLFAPTDDYMLYQDNFYDGNNVNVTLFGKFVYPGDSVSVELISIDKSIFDYFNGLNQLAPRGGGSSAAPANPPSNVSNGAVGYFSAEAISRKSIKVK
jgi:hypothetical protein